MSLPPNIDDIVAAHHDAFLYDLFGATAPLLADRIEELKTAGLVPDVPNPIMAVAGAKGLAAHPMMIAILMGATKQRLEPGRRRKADRWPVAKWATEISKQVPSVEAPPPIPPSVTSTDVSAPDLPPPPPPPSGASGGGGGRPPEPPEFMTELQRKSWIQARTRAGEFVRGLGNVVSENASTIVSEVWNGEQIEREADADQRAEMVEIIREETADATANNTKWRTSTAQKLASNLGNRTGDWTRNWERIARTELQGAYNEGSVLEAVEWDGPDASIARIPEPGACSDCRRVHMTRDGKPRVFKASDLLNNGTNVGRKRAQWQATIWPIHPNCRCDTQHIPAGMEFDDEWGLVYKAHSFSQLARLAKGKGVKPEEEDEWARAKAQAKKQGQGKNYAYIMAIFKQMTSTAKGYFYRGHPVPQAVRNAAKRGLAIRAKQPPSGKAGLDASEAKKQGIHSGVQGARALVSGSVSEDKIRRMARYFSRHAKDYKLDSGKSPEEDKGYVAGLLWGGEAGKSWANRMVAKFDKDRNRKPT